jgi:hypothetical protein
MNTSITTPRFPTVQDIDPDQYDGPVWTLGAEAIDYLNSLTTIRRPATLFTPERLPEPLCDPPLTYSTTGFVGTLFGYPVRCSTPSRESTFNPL